MIAVTTDGVDVLVNGERHTVEEARRLAEAIRSAVSSSRAEKTRREHFRDREARADIFRRIAGDTLREVDGKLWRLYLGVGAYVHGFDPATGQDVYGGPGASWELLPASPWGPVWLRYRRKGAIAHAWVGGDWFACGKPLPRRWEKEEAWPEAGSTTWRPPYGPARRCPECAKGVSDAA